MVRVDTCFQRVAPLTLAPTETESASLSAAMHTVVQ